MVVGNYSPQSVRVYKMELRRSRPKVDISCSHTSNGKVRRRPGIMPQVQDQQHGNSSHLSAWGILCHRSLQGRLPAQHCRQKQGLAQPLKQKANEDSLILPILNGISIRLPITFPWQAQKAF